MKYIWLISHLFGMVTHFPVFDSKMLIKCLTEIVNMVPLKQTTLNFYLINILTAVFVEWERSNRHMEFGRDFVWWWGTAFVLYCSIWTRLLHYCSELLQSVMLLTCCSHIIGSIIQYCCQIFNLFGEELSVKPQE